MLKAIRRVLLCTFNSHNPIRSAVRWDGFHYVGKCNSCGHDIRRLHHRKWRRDWWKLGEHALPGKDERFQNQIKH